MYQPQQTKLIVDLTKPLFSYKGAIRAGNNLISKPINFGLGPLTSGVITIENSNNFPVYITVQLLNSERKIFEVDPETALEFQGNIDEKVSQILGISLNSSPAIFNRPEVIKEIDIKIYQGIKDNGVYIYPETYFAIGPFFLDSTWSNPQNYAIQFKGKSDPVSTLKLDVLMTLTNPNKTFISFYDYAETSGRQNIVVGENFTSSQIYNTSGNSIMFRLDYSMGLPETILNNLEFNILLLQPGGMS